MEDNTIRIISGGIFLLGMVSLLFLSSVQDFDERRIDDLGSDGDAVIVKGTIKGARAIGNLTFVVIRQEKEIEVMLEGGEALSMLKKGQSVTVKGKVDEGGTTVEPFTLELG